MTQRKPGDIVLAQYNPITEAPLPNNPVYSRVILRIRNMIQVTLRVLRSGSIIERNIDLVSLGFVGSNAMSLRGAALLGLVGQFLRLPCFISLISISFN